MSIIKAEKLVKEFRVAVSGGAGFKGVVNALVKRERKLVEAVRGISFEIDRGELIGFIGPNGAGKSTTIKMMTGILTPTSGSVEVCGLLPYKSRIKNAFRIGAVFGQRTQLWWDLPVIESLRLLKKIYEIDDAMYRKNLGEFVEMLDMSSFLDRPVRQLSLGQRMRSDIAAAFLHSPDIVYLDEPTIGLDVTAKRHMREFIREVNAVRKTTIVLTTHDMQDIEDLSRRVMVINHGSIIYEGTVAEMRAAYNARRILTCRLGRPVDPQELRDIWGGQIDIQFRDMTLVARVPPSMSLSDVAAVVMHKCDVLDMDITDASIDEVIEEVYGA